MDLAVEPRVLAHTGIRATTFVYEIDFFRQPSYSQQAMRVAK